MSPQTEFGLGGVMSSAAICFPSHRSLFTVMYVIIVNTSIPIGSEC